MHDNEQIVNHHERKHKDILDNIDIKIDIVCDQILFNPSEETITITSCQLKNGNHIKPIINLARKEISTSRDHHITKSYHNAKPRSFQLNDNDCIEGVSDVICFVSTTVIFVILLVVLIFLMNKDHETPF